PHPDLHCLPTRRSSDLSTTASNLYLDPVLPEAAFQVWVSGRCIRFSVPVVLRDSPYPDDEGNNKLRPDKRPAAPAASPFCSGSGPTLPATLRRVQSPADWSRPQPARPAC